MTKDIIKNFDRYEISTHTLTWSVTFLRIRYQKKLEYFNSHAHVERDSVSKNVTKEDIDFNSHAHVERDETGSLHSRYFTIISTHTLTWSVTLRIVTQAQYHSHFNSHAHVERDKACGIRFTAL